MPYCLLSLQFALLSTTVLLAICLALGKSYASAPDDIDILAPVVRLSLVFAEALPLVLLEWSFPFICVTLFPNSAFITSHT
jgi:hypothetical protein